MRRAELSAALGAGAIMATRMLGLFMVYPLLVPYARSLPGSGAFLAGASLGVYGLTQGLLQIPLGALSDRWGRRRVLALGLVLLVIGSLIAALAHGIVGLLVGRALQGAGAIGSVALASISDRVHEDQRVKAMAVVGAAIGGAFVLALLLGPLVADGFGVSGVFALTAVLALVALVAFVPSMPAQPLPGRAVSLIPTLRGLLARPAVRRADYGIFAQHAAFTLVFVFLPALLVHRWGLAPSASWRFYVPVLLVALLVVGPLVPRLERGRKAEGALRPAFLVSAVALLVLAFLPGRIALAAAGVAYFAAFTLLEAILPAVLSRRLPPETRGSGMGLYSSAQFLGIFVGGLVGGLLLASGDRPGLVVAALLLVSSGVVTGRLVEPPSASPRASG